ncbi:pentatricopeptide repeat-containing protein At4g22760 [Malania oleifera]|uniref:pentatricopeptide repeat-containing protein At4g22760 n=1 Tax=Malania oleifera TaxID=397392 RepID=UPI0025AE627B|nr:pentatricopeptide repeat-containing protein At4g22760 [Malania oleifera]
MLISKLTALLYNSRTVNQASQIHAQVLVNGLHQIEPLLLRRPLLSASDCSRSIAQYAQSILHHLQEPDAVSWACSIRILSRHGQFKEAYALYAEMQRRGLTPGTFALSSVLKACARLVNKIGGFSIHAQIHKYGFCGGVYVQTALVDLYSKFGDMVAAQMVFDEMGERNVVSWNSLLSGYLKAGELSVARRVFDEIPRKDVISWNSMISGYASIGDMVGAYSLFGQMPERNIASWNAMVSGYVGSGNIELARNIFDAMPHRNNVSWITMISGYSKCGDVDSARELFDRMDEKDQLTCNAIIACYAQNSRPKKAIELFNKMLEPNGRIQPDKMTLVSVISACSQLGDVRFGSWIESYMRKLGIEIDNHLATALIDLYAKSGGIDRAYELFHNLGKRDLVAYTAMILGCGINGKATDAIKLFDEMMDAHICPNLVTFTGLLTAYNHAGLVEEGYHCFNSMKKYGLTPSADHYGIVVDLLGRAGRLQEAHQLIISMPMQPHAGVWGALLLACRLHNNVELGEIAANHCFELEPDTTGYCSLLANIYASVGRWEDAKRLRNVLQEKGFSKTPGCSWMETA